VAIKRAIVSTAAAPAKKGISFFIEYSPIPFSADLMTAPSAIADGAGGLTIMSSGVERRYSQTGCSNS
jgi:hypothetical protein